MSSISPKASTQVERVSFSSGGKIPRPRSGPSTVDAKRLSREGGGRRFPCCRGRTKGFLPYHSAFLLLSRLL